MPDEIKDPAAQSQAEGEKAKTKSPFGNIPKKHLYLLGGLLAVLLVFAAVKFVIMPKMDKIKEKEDQRDQLQSQYDDLLLKSQKYAQNEKTYTEAKTKFIEATDKLFPLMDSDGVDKTVTPKIKEMGLDISSLTIEGLTSFFVDSTGAITSDSMTYNQAVEYSEEEPTESPSDSAQVQEEATTAADDGQTYGEASEELAAGDTQPVTEPQNVNTGEYYYSLSYALTGTYDEIVNLVQNISKDPAMAIESITLSSGGGDGGASAGASLEGAGAQEGMTASALDGEYTVSIIIDVYMYDDPSTGVKYTTTMTDENGNIIAGTTTETTVAETAEAQ